MPACKVGVQLHPQATPIEDIRDAWKAADALGPAIARAVAVVRRGEPALVDVVCQLR